jgi:Cof subfamily protein (haloacid dehalogenase superfamily)
MGKILFASDMDGTLLNEKGRVAAHHVDTINALAEQGLCFTVATARAPRSAMGPVKESGFRVTAPAVCLNGALLWDMETDRPVKSFPLSDKAAAAVWQLMEAFPLAPRLFMEPSPDGLFQTLYLGHKYMDPAAYSYMEVLNSPLNPFAPITSFPAEGKIIAISYFDEPARLKPIYQAALQASGIKAVLYDSTAYENRAYMEIFSDTSGKGTGVLAAKEICGADQVFVFGDNFNDIDMFRVADQSFAPENGEEEMKKMATRVIPSNREGGVISTMAELFRLYQKGEQG